MASLKPDIVLNSPVGSKPAVYKWPLVHKSKGQRIDGAEEIIETIRWVAREYAEFKPAIDNLIPEQHDIKGYDAIKALCDKYNSITKYVMKMNRGTSIALKTSQRASQGLIKHIIQQVYNSSVDDPAELNKYSPFSSETYGETSFEFMAQLIERNQFKPQEDDTFIDLGSGVGHLVLQMAATVKCKKCYGIEVADRPAGYARKMEESFKFWMNWHGKIYTDLEIIHGNFFDKQYNDIICGATYIFVNNFAFKPDDDHKLKQKFLDLKDGVQILSSKPFCSPKSRVSERHLSDLGSIMQVIEIQPDQKKDTVSWTPKPLPYYLHVLDSSKLQKYYERQKRNSSKGKKKIQIKDTEAFSDESDDNFVHGPTTRKAWSEWCNSGSHLTPKPSGSKKQTSTDTSSSTLKSNTSSNKNSMGPDKNVTADLQHTKVTENLEKDNGNNNNSNLSAPKSCLDKKRDYASSFLQNPAPQYSISKSSDSTDGSSANKIPNIVIKVKPSTDESKQSVVEKPKSPEPVAKKLRQREKSVHSDDTGGSTSPAKTVASNLQADTIKQAASKQSTRSKKTTPTPTNNSARTALKSNTSSNRKSISSPEKNVSLDLLHAKTVESVSANTGNLNQPTPGCEYFSLKSIKETPSLPKVVITDVNMYMDTFSNHKILDRFFDQMKMELGNYQKKISQPNFKELLIRSIELQKAKMRELNKEFDDLTKHKNFLTERMHKAMKPHCDELGIKNTNRAVVQQLGLELKKHQELKALISQLETSLHHQNRLITPPPAHSNNPGPHKLIHNFRASMPTDSLDLSLKQQSAY